MTPTTAPLVSVRHLKKYFPIYKGTLLQRHVGDIKAVDDVSFDIYPGETLGLVGETGCGKTTVGRTMLRLYAPTSGSILINDIDLAGASESQMRKMRKHMQMIFQDPYASLNPRMTVGSIVSAPLDVHGVPNGKDKKERIDELLRLVGLNPDFVNRYPHEFSGGQRQRIGIARALVLQPKFIVCDEPVSALDVSIQAQVLNLLKQLQREFNLTYMFIAHNMSVVEHISDRIVVMYLGKVVEVAERLELYRNPQHPYTQALMSAIPVPIPDLKRERTILTGDVPSPLNPPSGCPFHPRCPVAIDICSRVVPPLIDLGGEHLAACHLRTPVVTR
jgi:oligopeptide transport system ATP-binding protein